MLDRAERLCGKTWTIATTNFLALGRTGLRETDLEQLIPVITNKPWDGLTFTTLRHTLGSFIVQRGAHCQWNFSSKIFHQSIINRNLTNEDEKRRFHSLIADHLRKLPDNDALLQGEMMVHLLGHGDRDEAAHFLAYVYTRKYYSHHVKGAFFGAVEALADAVNSAPDETSRTKITDWITSLLEREDKEQSTHIARVIISYLIDSIEDINATRISREKLKNAAYQTLQGLAETNLSDIELQKDLAKIMDEKGQMLEAQGDLAGALEFHRKSLKIEEQLLEINTNDFYVLYNICVSQEKICDILKISGNLSDALDGYQRSLSIRERLVAEDPRNADWLFGLSCCLEGLGNIFDAKGDPSVALSYYQQSYDIRERLVAEYPKNTNWQHHLSIGLGKIGRLLLFHGDPASALKFFRSLIITERLVSTNPNNFQWQRSLAIDQDNIGDAERFQGNLSEALRWYQASFDITMRLVQTNPSNIDWLRDLSISYEKMGDMLLNKGDLAEAMKMFNQGLEIAEQISEKDPSNAEGHRDLIVMLVKMAQLSEKSGQGGANIWWQKAYSTASNMKKFSSLSPLDEQRIEYIRKNIGR